MNTTVFRASVIVVALVATLCVANVAQAQCCGGGGATTAFYQPAAYTAYSPVAYTTVNTGWYPGYFLDRIRSRLWGAPSTYVAAYPTTYAAAYPSTYAAAYPSTYAAAYPSTHVAAYPSTYAASYPAYATSYSPCSTCAPAPQVTLRPVCTTCADPCTTCSSYSGGAAYGVSQTSYQEAGGCACNGSSPTSGTTIVVPNGTVVSPGMQQAPSNAGQPQLPETFETTPRSTEKPPGQALEPEPAGNNGGAAEGTHEGGTGNSGAYFERRSSLAPMTERHSAVSLR